MIPAHNEEDALPPLLAEIPMDLVRRVVVVDNNSTDGTSEVARKGGAEIVFCATPGYGSACLSGLAYLRRNPPEILVFLDGDRSDFPEYMARLTNPIAKGHYDFVLGSRALGKAESGSLTLPQRFGNRLATFLMRVFWGVSYSDLGPFRAISWPALELLEMADTNFGWTIEMQIKAHLAGLRTREVPIDYRCRIGTSKISGTVNGVVRAGYKILFTLFKFRFFPPAKPVGRRGERTS